VVGIVETGGHEDNQILVNLVLAQELSARDDKLHTVQVSALCTACPVDTFALEIEEQIPGVDAKSAKQVVNAEMSVLGKFENMMFIVTMATLMASILGVMTTMSTSVIERQSEIGLMKSLGAMRRQIVSLFLSEAGIIGLLGGVAGFCGGLVLAWLIGVYVFDVAITPRLSVLVIVVIISVGVSLLGSVLPIRRALGIEPAEVLKGE
jgi:putative ABC transport system permease protein